MKQTVTVLFSVFLTSLALGACFKSEDGDRNNANRQQRLEITAYLQNKDGSREKLETVFVRCQKNQENCIPLDAWEQVDLDPVPKSTPCTMIYGGPQEITLQGEVDGQRVNSQFNRISGCEIDRFESLEPLFRELGISKEELFIKKGQG